MCISNSVSCVNLHQSTVAENWHGLRHDPQWNWHAPLLKTYQRQGRQCRRFVDAQSAFDTLLYFDWREAVSVLSKHPQCCWCACLLKFARNWHCLSGSAKCCSWHGNLFRLTGERQCPYWADSHSATDWLTGERQCQYWADSHSATDWLERDSVSTEQTATVQLTW